MSEQEGTENERLRTVMAELGVPQELTGRVPLGDVHYSLDDDGLTLRRCEAIVVYEVGQEWLAREWLEWLNASPSERKTQAQVRRREAIEARRAAGERRGGKR